MEPLLPSGSPALEDQAQKVVSQSAGLGGWLHPVTRDSVVELLRLINSYYSNLTRGTAPIPLCGRGYCAGWMMPVSARRECCWISPSRFNSSSLTAD